MDTGKIGRDAPDIMIVDDEAGNLQVLTGILKQEGYKVRPSSSGRLALQVAKTEPPDMILLDINMPDMNGYEVCRRLKKNGKLKDIPVIFISALNETIDKVKAFSAGCVDYVSKPLQYEEVQARVKTHLKLHFLQSELEKQNSNLEKLVRDQVHEILESQMATIFAIAKLAEFRDEDTGKHLERIQTLCRILAQHLGKRARYKHQIDRFFINDIYHSSPLHDIGKVAIPDSILLKPGKLTPDEFSIMKTHASLGSDNLKEVNKNFPRNSFIEMGIEIARSHHERWDGCGYPDGLAGENIPLCARIMAVVDVYDALRSKRCYKIPMTHEDSLRIIHEGSETQFDPAIVNAFMEVHQEFEEISRMGNVKSTDGKPENMESPKDFRRENRIKADKLPTELRSFTVLLSGGEEKNIRTVDASPGGFGFFIDGSADQLLVGSHITLCPLGMDHPVHGKIVHSSASVNGFRVGVAMIETSTYGKYKDMIQGL